jgi:hypothetical protein
MQFNQVFLWGETEQEKTVVAASAWSDGIEIYYALKNQCSRRADSCTVSSHTWFTDFRPYWIQEVLVLD